MDIVKYLSRCNVIRTSIAHNQEQLVRLKQRLLYKEVNQEGDGGGGGSSGDRIPTILYKIEQLEEKTESLTHELYVMTGVITNLIDSVDDVDASEVLFMRYIQRNTYGQIATRLGRSTTWAYEKHEQGVNEVMYKLNETLHVMNVITDEIEFSGTLKEVAEYFNLPPQYIHAMYYQKIVSGNQAVIREKDDAEHYQEILKNAKRKYINMGNGDLWEQLRNSSSK